MSRALVAAFALSLPGCASLYGPSMDASQIKEIVKEKSGTVVCATVLGPWGTTKIVVINLDQERGQRGGTAQVDANCVATVNNLGAPPKP